MNDRSPRYSRTMRALHWSIAMLIAGNVGLGTCLASLRGMAPERWYDLHKGIGVVTLALVLLRCVRRVGFENLPPLPSMPRWQRRAAQATHAALYFLMVLIPVTGYLASSAAGYPAPVFGIVSIPPLIAEDREAYAMLRQVHEMTNYSSIVLLLVHVGAVLKHRLDGRDLLARMR